MKKALALLACAVALAGCSTTGALPETPQQAVFAAKSTYSTALTAAVAYKRLPACSAAVKPPCSDPAMVAQLQKADNVAAAALDAAEAAARTPQIGQSAAARAVQAAQASLAALTTLIAQLGAPK
jgi:hypothetical protein